MARIERLCTPGALHEGEVEIAEASSADAVLAAFAQARRSGRTLTLVGARRSFGGQAFPVAGGLGLDVSALDRGATQLSEEPDGSVWVRAGGGTRFRDLHEQFPGHRVHGAPTTITSPTTCTPAVTPSAASSRSETPEGQNSRSARWSTRTRLISSGIRLLKLRSPASTWATGTCSLAAARPPASVELVSP